ncbi:MAG: YihY family inner membrane protein [Alphaproteobacteria bacterium]
MLWFDRGGHSRPMAGALGVWLHDGLRFVAYVGRRFVVDDGSSRAGALAYTSLLAMVPLAAISFAIFSAFPAFDDARDQIQAFVFENFVPSVGSVVQEHLEAFTAQTGSLTAVGVVFLVVTSLMLLATVSRTFDSIWRVAEPRPVLAQLLVYWAVLTLTPLLFGASLSLSSYFFAVAQATGGDVLATPLQRLAGLVPLLLQIVGFSIVYLVIPHYPVRRADALAGGVVAGILFELLKRGFGWYLASFPSYQTIYGALAAFPIFLIWMYVTWMVVLLGAEIAAALPEWRVGLRVVETSDPPPSRRLSAALGILHALLVAQRRGRGLSRRAMLRAAQVGPAAVTAALRQLIAARYVIPSERNEYLLARDLERLSLNDLYSAMGMRLTPPSSHTLAGESWGPRFREIVERMNAVDRELMDVPLKTLLAPPDAAAAREMVELIERDEKATPGWRVRLLSWLGITWFGAS